MLKQRENMTKAEYSAKRKISEGPNTKMLLLDEFPNPIVAGVTFDPGDREYDDSSL